MSALEELRNKRGIHTPTEACILLAGESTIANEAATELASLRAAVAQAREAAKELREVIYQYDSGNSKYPFVVVRAELVEFYNTLTSLVESKGG